VQVEWSDALRPVLGELLTRSDVVLDGVLGSGIRLPLRPPAADLLSAVKTALPGNVRVIAVDIPSGIDCDTGVVAEETLQADLTVTMAAAKTGFYQFPAAKVLGRLRLAGIGLPDGLEEWESIDRFVLDAPQVGSWLPARPPDSHKGTFGTAWIVAGSKRFPGAALLAGRAAFRSGAGLVSTAPPESVYRIIAGHYPESVWLPLPEHDGAHTREGAAVLVDEVAKADSLLFGSGFGLAESTREFIVALLEAGSRLPPLVVDADGLKLLSQLENWSARLPSISVLTPHAGEMAVMTGLEVGAIQTDRIRTAEKFAADWGHVLVLKGAYSVIAGPEGRTVVIPISTPALARAGTGDVLAGLITGLRAQGMPAFEAAAAGAFIHALAGIHAAETVRDPAAVLPTDVIAAIGPVLSGLR
jgi:NAD(P)H-hydrate epimerase